MPEARIRTRLSLRGRWALRLALLAALTGLVIQDTVLLQLSLFVLFLLPLCAMFARLNLAGLEYTSHVPDRPFARKPFEARLVLHNRNRWFQRFTINVTDGLLTTKAGNWMVDAIGPGEELEVRRSSHMQRRGRVETGEVALRSSFPFGLFETERRWQQPLDMVVYPAPLFPNNARQWAQDPYRDPEASQCDVPQDMGEFRSLREFRSGDRIKAVHWGASARHGFMMVREFDPPLAGAYSFIFHSFCPDGVMVTPQNFERCMQLLCGFFLVCRDRNIPFEFTASFNRWKPVEVHDPTQLDQALELLACSQQRPERQPQRLIDRVRRQARMRRCFVVSNTPLDHWEGLMKEIDQPIDCVDAHTWRSTLREAVRV